MAAALAVVVVLIPTLLYYGGGWLQYGYRYFLDSIPFLWAMVAMWVAKRGGMPWWGWTLVGLERADGARWRCTGRTTCAETATAGGPRTAGGASAAG